MIELDRVRLEALLGEREPTEHRADARAAVAATLRREDDRTEVLLIQRAEHPGDPWSGHMAFPGGRHEPRDATLLDTAIRETREEIGLSLPDCASHLGRLDDVPTHTTGLVVRPHVFWLERTPPPLALNYEVARAVWVPLGELFGGARDATYELDWKGQAHTFPGYAVGDRVVWGLTYRMLGMLRALTER